MVGAFVGAAMVLALGVFDDCRRAPWHLKLAVIFVAAAVAVWLGVRITMVRRPFGEGPLFLGVWSAPVTLLWLVVITNAFNLIDGLDGLAAGLCAISGATLALMAWQNPRMLPLAFAAAGLAGASIGFLYYNFNPARLFMGDGGAYFLGFSLGCISVVGAMKTPVAVTVAIPLLVFAIPILDTTWAVLRLLASGSPVMSVPDRNHLHHKLLERGLSQRQVVIAIYAISLLLCAAALKLYRG